MSSSRLKHLYMLAAVGVSVLQAYGCRDLPKVNGDSTQSTQSGHSEIANYSTTEQPPIKKAQPAEPVNKEEALGGALHGACSREDREDYVHDASRKFTNQLRACSKDTWANNSKNLACLTANLPTLSKGCARCFADMASCARDNCKMACMMDSKGSKCISCANANCQAALVRCTGVARADLP